MCSCVTSSRVPTIVSDDNRLTHRNRITAMIIAVMAIVVRLAVWTHLIIAQPAFFTSMISRLITSNRAISDTK